jgi:hypothetical protein
MRGCLHRAGCVDQDNLDVVPAGFNKGAEYHAADPAKAADG